MSVGFILYTSGYKYQLQASYELQVPLTGFNTGNEWVKLTDDGWLVIAEGYAWDGASGPTIDTLNTMRGSLVHDALYQLMREGHLPTSCRLTADTVLRDLLLKDGMSKVRAWIWFRAVRRAAGGAASPSHRRKVMSAPKR